MVKKARKNILPGGLFGAAVILLISTALCGLFALLVSSGRVGEGSEKQLVALAAFLASVGGALTAWRKNGGMALPSGALAAAIAIVLRLLLTVFSGTPVGSEMLTISAAMLLGGVLTGFLAAGRRKKRR